MAEEHAAPEDEQERRRRIERAERLLGGLLPRESEDAEASDLNDSRRESNRDEELRRDVPPHHGKD